MNNVRPPMTGLCFWSLVQPYKTLLQASVPIPATLMDIDVDCLVVQVGPKVPYRLLVVNSGADGLIQIQLWQVTNKLKVLVDEKVMSDLVGERLKAIAKEHNLKS